MPTSKKKSTPHKNAPKKAVKHEMNQEDEPVFPSEPPSETKSNNDNAKKFLLAAIVIVLIAAALYYSKGYFIAATVNGKPISRLSVIKQLEQESGKRTLQNMITKMLVLQEADRRHITISDKELSDEFSRIKKQVESQGQSLDQILALQGLTQKELMEQIKTEKLVEKMFANEASPSADEVQKYVTDNASSFPESMTDEEKNQQAMQQLKQQKLSQKVQALIDDLQKKAKINYYVNY